MESLLLGGSASHAIDLHGEPDKTCQERGGGPTGHRCTVQSRFIHCDHLSAKSVSSNQPAASEKDALRSAHSQTFSRRISSNPNGEGGKKRHFDFAILSVRFYNDGVAQGR